MSSYNLITIIRSLVPWQQPSALSSLLPGSEVALSSLPRLEVRHPQQPHPQIYHSATTTEAFCSTVYSFADVFWQKCSIVNFRLGAKVTDASSRIDVRRLKVGDLLENISTLSIPMSSISCSRLAAISVPVTRQRRHLEGIQCD